MIATWQYVALGGIVAAILAVLQYKTWRTEVGDSILFPRLEAAIASALAAEHFVLTSKTHSSKSFGNRTWDFERPPKAIRVYWDGKEREIIVDMQEATSPQPVRRRIAATGVGTGNPSDRYQHVVTELVEAIIAALRTEA